ncbi:MAG: response regulator transcription factor [Acidobacteria bacterium]|nr:response regulator transcription factor [Acidobacteriota bacterium]
MKVIIADDHVILREGIRQILDCESDIEVVGEASDGAELFKLILENKVDVIVLDITMPGQSGLEILKDVTRLYPKTPVIMLSMHRSDQYALRSFRAGASGYLTKQAASDELVAAIRTAHRGEKYVNSEVAGIFANFFKKGEPAELHALLSDRELEVFRLIALGIGLSQIGQQMNLSVKTISTYRSRIMEKTGFLSNADITRYSIENKLS